MRGGCVCLASLRHISGVERILSEGQNTMVFWLSGRCFQLNNTLYSMQMSGFLFCRALIFSRQLCWFCLPAWVVNIRDMHQVGPSPLNSKVKRSEISAARLPLPPPTGEHIVAQKDVHPGAEIALWKRAALGPQLVTDLLELILRVAV
jgi:hypothetical protein